MPRRAALAVRVPCLVAVVLGGLGGSSGAGSETPPRLHRVVIEDFAFRPARLEIQAGDSVEWVNRDIAPHTASAENGAWDSGELAKRARFRVTFDGAGSHPYFCAFHPQMRGEITVAAP